MSKLILDKRTYTEKSKKHSHEHGQLIIPLQGALSIETDDKNLDIDDKKIFMVPPSTDHAYKANQINSFLIMDIPAYLLKSEDVQKMAGGSLMDLDSRWLAIRSLLLEEIKTGEEGSNLKSLFQYMYQFLTEDKLFDLVQYIHDHFDYDIDLQTLAALEHYNPTYYTEWFKKHMGVTPKEYIQKVRLERSKELLRDTDYTILQIAQMVGYQHHGSLTRLFKERYGISPATFRKAIRKQVKF